MKKNKKADLALNYVVIGIILLIVAVVILMIFKTLMNKQAGETSKLIEDHDNDNIVDIFDRCPCKYGETEFKGCSSAEELTKITADPPQIPDRTCLVKK